jgi:hypothetical protein
VKTFTTVIDVVERALGRKLTLKFLSKRRGIDLDVRKRISVEFGKYESEDSHFHVPPQNITEVFPYVHPRWLISDELGMRSYKKAVDSEISKIKSLLLYYHRVALPDGFGYLCDYYRLGASSDRELDIAFDSYLKFFAELRPLVQDGTIFFMPEIPTYFRARGAVEKLLLPEWVEEEIESSSMPVRTLHRIMEESLWIGKQFNLDLLFPSNIASSHFEKHLLHTSQKVPQTRIQESKVGSIILEAQLPRIENLSIADIATIRRGSDSFAAWRANLRAILSSFYYDYSGSSLDQSEFERFAFEELAEGRMKIEKEVAESHYLNLLKTGLKSVGVGVVSAALVTPLAPTATVLSAVAGAGSTFLIDYLLAKSNRSEVKQLNALRTHYAIFNPNSVN